jgi:hypothetical protein
MKVYGGEEVYIIKYHAIETSGSGHIALPFLSLIVDENE